MFNKILHGVKYLHQAEILHIFEYYIPEHDTANQGL